MTKLTYGSVCSGIEAASVAWEPLGFWAEWFSEIEAFPAAVLAHHWPDVPNLGDMLALPTLVASGEIAAPDVLVGGTPCQAFSVAGNRESLADARGGLTLAYVELADAIDRQRARDGQDPCIVVWENVPGVLSTKDNAFGCFLAGLAGEDVPLLPPGKRWTNAGLVLGPKRAVAWRILDAQYFGLAQRRRRVFVVASARDGFDPSAVLLEFEGVRRDSAPRREAREETPRDAGPGATGASHWDAVTNPHPTLNQAYNTGGIGASNQEVFSQRGSGLVPTPYQDVAHCLNAGGMGRIDYETESFVVNAAIPILEPGARTGKSTNDVRAGIGVGADGDPMYTLQAGKQHGVAFAQNTRDEVRLIGGDGSLVGALAASSGTKQTSYAACVFDVKGGLAPHGRAALSEVAHPVLASAYKDPQVACVSVTGDIAHTLNTANNGKGCSEAGTGRGVPTIAFSSKDYGADATENMAPTLRAGGHANSHANRGVPPAVTVALRGREGGATAEVGGEVATALRASTGGGDKPHVLAFHHNAQAAQLPTEARDTSVSDSLTCSQQAAAVGMAVRRLTPTECERLQGFPDGHTDVPYRKKSAADGPRYKAIGNSMAVPCMAWIGRRIMQHLNGEI